MVYPHSYRTEHSETKTTNSTYGEYYVRVLSNKVPIQPELLNILHYIDSNRTLFKKHLADAVAIKSISRSIEHRNDVIKMIHFTEDWLKRLGIKYECFNIGFHEIDGKKFRLPPVILGQLGTNPNKKTIGVYAHLDVKAPTLCKWETDPWKLTEDKLILYGNGAAGGKCALICWFHVIQAFQAENTDLPVNIKFIIESMYHHDSEGFEDFLNQRKQDFLWNIDCIVVCDSEWISHKIPCIIYGTVGMLHFQLTAEKSEESTTDPKDDVEKIIKTIADDEGNILIPHFNDFVQQITPDEEKLYEIITDFDVDEIRESLPPSKKNWDQVSILMHFWRLPSIYVHELQVCTCDKKDTTIVKRPFIIKIVPRQLVGKSIELTKKHVSNAIKELNIKNKVELEVISGTRPWVENIRSPNFQAACAAAKQIYKEAPNMIREDRDRVTVTMLHRISDKPILLLPLGQKNNNIGESNENIRTKNFYEGTKFLAAYLFQMALT